MLLAETRSLMVLHELRLQVVLDEHEVALLHVERLKVFGGKQFGRSALVRRDQLFLPARFSAAHKCCKLEVIILNWTFGCRTARTDRQR